jgi:hypothetical protein
VFGSKFETRSGHLDTHALRLRWGWFVASYRVLPPNTSCLGLGSSMTCLYHVQSNLVWWDLAGSGATLLNISDTVIAKVFFSNKARGKQCQQRDLWRSFRPYNQPHVTLDSKNDTDSNTPYHTDDFCHGSITSTGNFILLAADSATYLTNSEFQISLNT